MIEINDDWRHASKLIQAIQRGEAAASAAAASGDQDLAWLWMHAVAELARPPPSALQAAAQELAPPLPSSIGGGGS